MYWLKVKRVTTGEHNNGAGATGPSITRNTMQKQSSCAGILLGSDGNRVATKYHKRARLTIISLVNQQFEPLCIACSAFSPQKVSFATGLLMLVIRKKEETAKSGRCDSVRPEARRGEKRLRRR